MSMILFVSLASSAAARRSSHSLRLPFRFVLLYNSLACSSYVMTVLVH